MLVVRKKRSSRRKPSSKKRLRSRRIGGVKRASVVKELHPFTLAHVNPFDRRCFDARVPDQSTAPSSAFFLYDTYELATNTVNAACFALTPWTGYFGLPATNNTSTTAWTWSAAFANKQIYSKYTNVAAQYTLWRPVASGARLSCPLSPQTVTGYCHVCLYPVTSYGDTTYEFPLNISQMQDCPFYQRFTLAQLIAKPITVVNKFSDDKAFVYRDTGDYGQATATGTEYHNFGWMAIIVAVTGQPTGTTALNIENITHGEGQAIVGQLSGDLTSEKFRPSVMAGTAEYVADNSPVIDGNNQTPAPVLNQVTEFLGKCAADITSPFIMRTVNNMMSSARTQPGSNLRLTGKNCIAKWKEVLTES